MLSRKAGEAEVRELFLPYGEIREIYMIRNTDGSSKCAAFLRYMKREAAYKAIESLHNNIVMEGAARPLIVKFADNKHQRQARHMRNARKQEMMAAMGGPGFPGGYAVSRVSFLSIAKLDVGLTHLFSPDRSLPDLIQLP